ncbi:MAG: VRR-NUC domain-containing protein [Bacteroidales bacterium]
MTENLNGRVIRKTFQEIPIWKGNKIVDTYGNKTILDFNGNPLFAELFALRTFKEKGFSGVWADTYRRTFRTELPEKKETKISLPIFVTEKLNKINPNGKLSGTWDLILWKEEELKFVELKRQGKDRIRQTQIEFLERALKNGIPIENFEIFEWKEK